MITKQKYQDLKGKNIIPFENVSGGKMEMISLPSQQVLTPFLQRGDSQNGFNLACCFKKIIYAFE